LSAEEVTAVPHGDLTLIGQLQVRFVDERGGIENGTVGAAAPQRAACEPPELGIEMEEVVERFRRSAARGLQHARDLLPGRHHRLPFREFEMVIFNVQVRLGYKSGRIGAGSAAGAGSADTEALGENADQLLGRPQGLRDGCARRESHRTKKGDDGLFDHRP
jgi:hypothetical protein